MRGESFDYAYGRVDQFAVRVKEIESSDDRAELIEALNEARKDALTLGAELNLRNEAMARIENALEEIIEISRAIRTSEENVIFIEDRKIEEIVNLVEFAKRLRRPSRLTQIQIPKNKKRKVSN